MIEIRGLIKIYPGKERYMRALDDVSLTVAPGECFGLLGLNGAGKTTMLKVLATLMLPDGGAVTVNGFDVVRQSHQVRSCLGFCSTEADGLYLRLSGEDNLRFFATLHHVPESVIRRRSEALLQFFDLWEARRKLAKDYSTGMKSKLKIARALIHNPPILLLDEPTSGLDYASALQLYELLQILNKEHGKTILYTSHHLKEVEELCQRVGIIHQGRITACGTVDHLKRTLPHPHIVEVKLRSRAPEVINQVLAGRGVQAILEESEEVTVAGPLTVLRLQVADPHQAVDSLARVLVPSAHLAGLTILEPGLEDVFIAQTKAAGEVI
ncbi:MAG TPA: ABC transporter ATP-binding protein [Symbiobacteriaceae bacterium]|nr:ABC transporter ATP-binding protein [Symbiobacteriaceae bacterium]